MTYNAKWLENIFFSHIKTDFHNNIINITVPGFFGQENKDLKVSLFKNENTYFINDNGYALKSLNCNSDFSSQPNLSSSFENGVFYNSFSQIFHFLKYFHRLIYISNLNFYEDHAEAILQKCNIQSSPDEAPSPTNKDEIINSLKSGFKFIDDGDKIHLHIATGYTGISSLHTAYTFESKDGKIVISDRYKGEYEGEIFEALYWYNDEITPYKSLITQVCKHYQVEFDGRNIFVTVEPDKVISGFFRFLNAAVVLSQLRRTIDLD